ncbi:MAG: hypothetical protein MAG453_00001 [Calditrichaeota bacterium]|nr:hypothetical protein [Calditrichota bacterium]
MQRCGRVIHLAAVAAAMFAAGPVAAQQVWHDLFQPDPYETSFPIDILPGPGNTFGFVANGYDQGLSAGVGVVGELTPAGETLWTAEISSGQYDVGTSLNAGVRSADNSIVAAGLRFYDEPPFWYYGVLAEIDSSGVLDWQIEYESQVGRIVSVDTTSSGYVLLHGPPEIYSFVDRVTKVSAAGVIQAQYDLDFVSVGARIRTVPGGGFVVYGSGPNRFARISSNGNLSWYVDMVAHDVALATDGGFAVVSDSSLVKLNGAGTQMWSVALDQPYGVTTTADGGYVVCDRHATFHKLSESGELLGSAGDPELDDFNVIRVARTSPDLYAASLHYDFENYILFASAGSPVQISLQPLNNGVPVPPTGGVLVYGVTLTSLSGSPISGQAWSSVTTPGGLTITLQVATVSLSPGETINHPYLTLFVPAAAPAGSYTFTGGAGIYPGYLADSDSFQFAKSPWPRDAPDRDSAEGEFEWWVAGWPAEMEADGWPGARPGFHTPADDPRGRARTGGSDLAGGDRGFREAGLREGDPGFGEAGLHVAPNPFNETTVITVGLPAAGELNVAVFDITGRRVATLADGVHPPGAYRFTFAAGGRASGIYIVRVSGAGIETATRRVALVR